MVKNGSKWPEMAKMAKITENGLKRFEMIKIA